MFDPKDSENLNKQPAAVDAAIYIIVSGDNMSASVQLDPPVNGGSAPTVDAMQAALSARGIARNISLDKLKQLEASPVYSMDILVASGVAPIHGMDGQATFHIGTDKNAPSPRIKEDGTADYRDLNLVENVRRGQVLCTITLPTDGTPGFSVTGAELPPKKGRPVAPLMGKNTELTAEGAIVSKIDGQVDFDGHKIHVNETFQVKENVDNSTGNLKVIGNLFIPSTVMPGFKAEAGGNIQIGVRAEGSTLIAGRNINIHGGINGGKVNCGGDLKCRFIENSDVFVKGNIQTEYIINSTVRCGKSIKVSGTVSKIIGGLYTAGLNIEANTIGSPANVQTRLELGTDHTIIDRQQRLLAQVKELEAQNKSLTPLISLLLQMQANNRLTPDKKEALDKANFTFDNNTRLLEDAKAELEEIAQSVKARGFGRIICAGIIHPGTKVVIAEASMDVKDPLSNASLYFSGGAIQIGVAGRRS